jgi:shikimate dehydrogenase
MTDHYAVFGNPIAHSRSPRIHAMFAEQTGERIDYQARLATRDGFAAALQDFIADGGRGANVTVPFKLEAHALATQLSPRAEAAGAVNTLSFDGGKILGDNTDGIGLVRDLMQNHHCKLKGRRVLLIGAGGAARGVLQPLLNENPALLLIANRTLETAQALVEATKAYPAQLVAIALNALSGQTFDVIINATSAGLEDANISPCDGVSPAPTGEFFYEMVYGRETAFMRQARASGARVADGLGMLVEQAAEAFYVWRGVRPDTLPVLATIRAELDKQQR